MNNINFNNCKLINIVWIERGILLTAIHYIVKYYDKLLDRTIIINNHNYRKILRILFPKLKFKRYTKDKESNFYFNIRTIIKKQDIVIDYLSNYDNNIHTKKVSLVPWYDMNDILISYVYNMKHSLSSYDYKDFIGEFSKCRRGSYYNNMVWDMYMEFKILKDYSTFMMKNIRYAFEIINQYVKRNYTNIPNNYYIPFNNMNMGNTSMGSNMYNTSMGNTNMYNTSMGSNNMYNTSSIPVKPKVVKVKRDMEYKSTYDEDETLEYSKPRKVTKSVGTTMKEYISAPKLADTMSEPTRVNMGESASMPTRVTMSESANMPKREVKGDNTSMPTSVTMGESASMPKREVKGINTSMPTSVTMSESASMPKREVKGDNTSMPTSVTMGESANMHAREAKGDNTSIPTSVTMGESANMHAREVKGPNTSIPKTKIVTFNSGPIVQQSGPKRVEQIVPNKVEQARPTNMTVYRSDAESSGPKKPHSIPIAKSHETTTVGQEHTNRDIIESLEKIPLEKISKKYISPEHDDMMNQLISLMNGRIDELGNLI